MSGRAEVADCLEQLLLMAPECVAGLDAWLAARRAAEMGNTVTDVGSLEHAYRTRARRFDHLMEQLRAAILATGEPVARDALDPDAIAARVRDLIADALPTETPA